MKNNILPAIWLIVLIAGLPQLSETVYTPSLPEIAETLRTSESMVEYTLTIYLFSFAIGSLFWGKLSDSIGRKPCVIAGLLIFIVGCVGCYLSSSITVLMISRFIQAFGGSIGSVIGQAICRDSWDGPALGKVYSSVFSAMAAFPAIGPVIGGFIAQTYGWPSIFLFLIIFAVMLVIVCITRLPETHYSNNRQSNSIVNVALSLLKDRKVVSFGLIVAACNGIMFSYFAEGSFYLIKILGLSPSEYGLSFIALAVSTMFGGIMSRTLHNHHTSKTIMKYGLRLILIASGIFSLLVLLHTKCNLLSQQWMIIVTIISQMSIMCGIGMVVTNALALALVDYKWCIGTASSIFGCFYYLGISLFTFGMGLLHNGTLIPMPLYFFAVGILMLMVKKLV